MDNRTIIANFLKDWKIDSLKKFLYALNVCGIYYDCWDLTGISGNSIRRFLSKNSRRQTYKTFKIPKKSGGFRTISSPGNQLKNIQRAINALLLSMQWDFAVIEEVTLTQKSISGKPVFSTPTWRISSQASQNRWLEKP